MNAASRSAASDKALLEELAALYEDVDAAFAGWSCPASTQCCRFGLTGVEPYVTSIEYLAVLKAIQARGGRLHEKRRALPLAGTGVRDERTCPLLDREGRCAIYASRPLGCRTFYCTGASEAQPVPHARVLEMVRRVQKLGARHTPGGELSHRLGKMRGV
jgi:Fe-S-cluster containining protein